MTQDHSIRNALFGTAIGDAWGRSVEFVPFEYLQRDDYAPSVPYAGFDEYNPTLMVTDDTQMNVHTMNAIRSAQKTGLDDMPHVFAELKREFIMWHSEAQYEFDKAPSPVSMDSISFMEDYERSPFPPTDHMMFSDGETEGNGSLMRTSWLGLDPHIPENQLAPIVRLQSEITHSHALPVLSCVLWARFIREIRTQRLPAGEWLKFLDVELTGSSWVEDIRQQSPDIDREIARLKDTLSRVPEVIEKMRETDVLDYDPCSDLGGGWTAHEALALSVSIALTYAENPTEALRRAVIIGGDSDTVAALTGALVGVSHAEPITEWEEFFVDVEQPYQQHIRDIAEYMTHDA